MTRTTLFFFLIATNHGLTQTTLPPEMIFVQGGTFTMGCTPEQQPGCDVDETPTRITRVQSFWIGKYEVSAGQWQEIMGNAFNPNVGPPSGPEYPILFLSYYDAATFCNRLSVSLNLLPCYFSDNQLTMIFDSLITDYPNTDVSLPEYSIYLDPTANGFRLPTESEWEFAARGGNYSSLNRYSGSNDYNAVVAFDTYMPRPIGTKMPNEIGLYDMSGNAEEWCNDTYSDYAAYPSECVLSFSKTKRGGPILGPTFCRIAYRHHYVPQQPFFTYANGFRLARNTD